MRQKSKRRLSDEAEEGGQELSRRHWSSIVLPEALARDIADYKRLWRNASSDSRIGLIKPEELDTLVHWAADRRKETGDLDDGMVFKQQQMLDHLQEKFNTTSTAQVIATEQEQILVAERKIYEQIVEMLFLGE